MGVRHADRRRRLRLARKKEAQKKIGRNSVCRGRCGRRLDKPPSKGPKRVLFGGKKRHTLKMRVIIERNSREIIDVQEAKGSDHDFKVFKDTIGKGVSNSIPLDANSGCRGIEAYHSNSFMPVKSSKNRHLTEEEKAYNKELARRRVVIEHINAQIFKSMTYPYRGHCRNLHALRMTLICGIINVVLFSCYAFPAACGWGKSGRSGLNRLFLIAKF
jgi:hypothetical protein